MDKELRAISELEKKLEVFYLKQRTGDYRRSLVNRIETMKKQISEGDTVTGLLAAPTLPPQNMDVQEAALEVDSLEEDYSENERSDYQTSVQVRAQEADTRQSQGPAAHSQVS